jgi:RHS repeat-associated protein
MDIGLYDYNARYYAPTLARFISADTLIPDPANPQSLNRYAYTLNSPLRFIDPTGHFTDEAIEEYLQDNFEDWESILFQWKNDEVWWAMITQAEAGDLLVASIATVGGGGFFYFLGEGQESLAGIVFVNDPNIAASNDSSLARYFQGISLQNFFTGYFEKQTTIDLGIWGALNSYSSSSVNWIGIIKNVGTPDIRFLARGRNASFSVTDQFRDYVSYGASAIFNSMSAAAASAGYPQLAGLISLGSTTGSTDVANAYIDYHGFLATDIHVFMAPHYFVVRNSEIYLAGVTGNPIRYWRTE